MIVHSKPYITGDDISSVQSVLESGNIASRGKTKLFETEFAKYVNASSAYSTESEIAIYYFHATKLLNTGEGRMVKTNNNKIASRIKELEEQNAVASPMSDLQAALGLYQLGKYDKILEMRKKIAKNYFQNIKAHS